MNVDIGRPQAYTTGAYISPQKIKINDRYVWVWVVDNFEDDTFYNGDYLSVSSIGDNAENLIEKIDIESEKTYT